MVAILEGRDPALADQYAEAEKREQEKNKPEEKPQAIPLWGSQEEPSAPSQPDQPSEDKTTEE